MLIVLTGLVRPLITLDRQQLAAIVVGLLAEVLESTPLLQASLVPQEAEPALRAALGDDEFDRLYETRRGMNFAEIAGTVLSEMDDLIGEATH